MSIQDKKRIIWILVYTKVKQEKRAKENLMNQGFKTFLPMIATTNDHTKSLTLETVFPRYLFTQINLSLDNWVSIKSTKGVSHIVMFGKKFAVISDKIIESIKGRLNDKGIYQQRISKADFQKGDKLIIKEGRFSGVDAIFISRKSKNRVRLLLKLLKTSVITEVDKSDIGLKETIEELRF